MCITPVILLAHSGDIYVLSSQKKTDDEYTQMSSWEFKNLYQCYDFSPTKLKMYYWRSLVVLSQQWLDLECVMLGLIHGAVLGTSIKGVNTACTKWPG